MSREERKIHEITRDVFSKGITTGKRKTKKRDRQKMKEIVWEQISISRTTIRVNAYFTLNTEQNVAHCQLINSVSFGAIVSHSIEKMKCKECERVRGEFGK